MWEARARAEEATSQAAQAAADVQRWRQQANDEKKQRQAAEEHAQRWWAAEEEEQQWRQAAEEEAQRRQAAEEEAQQARMNTARLETQCEELRSQVQSLLSALQGAVARGSGLAGEEAAQASGSAAAAAAPEAAAEPAEEAELEVSLATSNRDEVGRFFGVPTASKAALDDAIAAIKGPVTAHSEAHPTLRLLRARLQLPGVCEQLCPLLLAAPRNRAKRLHLSSFDPFKLRQPRLEGGGSEEQQAQQARLPQLLPQAFLCLVSAERRAEGRLPALQAGARCTLVLEYEDPYQRKGEVAAVARLVWDGSSGGQPGEGAA